ncbi:MAG: cell division protein FtsA [Leptospiraceae bacterium]|nr:cell division protein FtsA [Leptospiraceae bacterium]MCP5499625.1 cell division protein FtsA [Leptospiraceae bacterium]
MQDLYNGIAALDLGSSLVKVVVGRPIKENEIEIIGTGTSRCTGIKNGAIINLETTTKSIIEAIDDAALMSGQDLDSVIVNITGKTIKADNSRGVVAITNKERTVIESDVRRVIEAAQSIRIPTDQQILHVLSREFAVDDQTNIKEPLGMTGVRLEADVHIVTAGITTIHNIDKCLEMAGLSQIDKVLSSFASSEAVLTSGEKELGTAVVDIGAGITDVVVYIDGGIAFSCVIPFGGNHITNDISIGLKTPVEAAELIKKRYGHTMINDVDPTEKIEVPATSGRVPRVVLRQDLIRIIAPRVKEILELVNNELETSGKKSFLAGGVILTGGTSLLQGIDVLAEEVLELSVGRAKPAGLTGLAERVASPEYSTAVGLIKYVARSLQIDTKRPQKLYNSQEKDSWSKKVWRWMETNL